MNKHIAKYKVRDDLNIMCLPVLIRNWSFFATIVQNANTSLVKENLYLRNRQAWMKKSQSLNAAVINKVRKRMAGMNKHIAKYKVRDDLNIMCLPVLIRNWSFFATIVQNTNTSLVKEIVYLRNRQASMTKSHKRQKRTLVHLKDKYNELTDKTTGLSTLLVSIFFSSSNH